jgi:hypothetical protein
MTSVVFGYTQVSVTVYLTRDVYFATPGSAVLRSCVLVRARGFVGATRACAVVYKRLPSRRIYPPYFYPKTSHVLPCIATLPYFVSLRYLAPHRYTTLLRIATL